MDGRPLTGLEPFPPWNFAEGGKIKKKVQAKNLYQNEEKPEILTSK